MATTKKYVVNPKTGRRVLADGPTGKKVLKARRAKRARAANKVKSCVASCTRKCLAKKRKSTPKTKPRRRTTNDYVSVSDVYGDDYDVDVYDDDYVRDDYVSMSDIYG